MCWHGGNRTMDETEEFRSVLAHWKMREAKFELLWLESLLFPEDILPHIHSSGFEHFPQQNLRHRARNWCTKRTESGFQKPHKNGHHPNFDRKEHRSKGAGIPICHAYTLVAGLLLHSYQTIYPTPRVHRQTSPPKWPGLFGQTANEATAWRWSCWMGRSWPSNCRTGHRKYHHCVNCLENYESTAPTCHKSHFFRWGMVQRQLKGRNWLPCFVLCSTFAEEFPSSNRLAPGL